VISPDIGGGRNKVPSTRATSARFVRLDRDRQTGQVVEDGSENLMSTVFARARLPHARRVASTKEADSRRTGERARDHGAFNGTAQPTNFPAGFFHIFSGSYDLISAHCTVTGRVHQQAPGGVAYACSFPGDRGGPPYVIERMIDILAYE